MPPPSFQTHQESTVFDNDPNKPHHHRSFPHAANDMNGMIGISVALVNTIF